MSNLRKRMWQTTLAIGTGRVVSVASNLALAVLAGPAAWGAFSIVRSATELGQIWARGSTEITAYRYVSIAKDETRSQVAARLLIMGGALSITSIALTLTYLLLSNGHISQSDIWIATAALPIYLIGASSSLNAACRTTSNLLTEQIINPTIRFAVFLAVLYLTNHKLNALSISLLISSIITVVISLSRLRSISNIFSFSNLIISFRDKQGTKWSEFLFVGLSILLVSLVSRFDVIIIGETFGAASAGNYSLIAAAAGMVTLVSSVLSRELAPRISTLASSSGPDQGQDEQGKFERLGFVAACALSAAVQLALAIAMPLTGYVYNFEYSIAASFLTLSYAITSSYGLSGYKLTMNGRYKIEFMILLFQALFFMLACLVAAKFGSIWGIGACAAIASFLTVMLRNLILRKTLTYRGYEQSFINTLAWSTYALISQFSISLALLLFNPPTLGIKLTILMSAAVISVTSALFTLKRSDLNWLKSKVINSPSNILDR